MKKKLRTVMAIQADDEKCEEDDENISETIDIHDEFDDESDNDELDDVHNRLLAAIDKFSYQTTDISSEEQITGKTKNSTQNQPENVYAANSSVNVSMNALLEALDGSQSIDAVKKKLSSFEKSLNIPTFIEKTTSQRVERSLIYSSTTNEVNKWQDIVV